jgi:hypothetical protein
MWRAGFGRGVGPVVRQTAKWKWNCKLRQICHHCVKKLPFNPLAPELSFKF